MIEFRSAPANLRRPQGGPPPLVAALAYGALMIAAVAVSAPACPAPPAAEALAHARPRGNARGQDWQGAR